MSIRVLTASLLAAVALLAGGCGGDGAGGGDSAASLVSSTTAAYVEVDTNADSDQWDQVEALAEKFPGRGQLIALIRAELRKDGVDYERDVKPALGDNIAFLWLDFENEGDNVIGLTKPKDEGKFKALVTKLDEEEGETVYREIEGWTVFAEKNAHLDRFERSLEGDALEDHEPYANALENLPDERLATFYVAGEPIGRLIRRDLSDEPELRGVRFFRDIAKIESIAGALAAQDNGIRTTLYTKAPEDVLESFGFGHSYESALVDEIPGDALALVSFSGEGYREQIDAFREGARDAFGQFEPMLRQMLGVSLNDVLALLRGEGAFYARPGVPFPEATLLFRQPNEQRALGTVDRIARKLGALAGAAPRTSMIEGVAVKTIPIQALGFSYAAFDDKLVLTISPTAAVRGLRHSDTKLGDDADFEASAEAAEMPERNVGFFYLDIEDSLPIAETLLGFAGAEADVPPNVIENLRPLRSLISYGTEDGGEATYVLFLEIE